MAGNETDEELAAKAENWPELLSPQKLSMDQQHFFQKHQLQDLGPVNCVRLNIFPEGGISRLRIFGCPPVLRIDASNLTHSAYCSGLC